jgi:hypothetical protein
VTMNTKTLVVGQDVFVMNWEGVFIDGKVSKVTPEGVEVFVPNGSHACNSPHAPRTWRFDSKGEAIEQYWDGGTCTIDDMPFEERKAKLVEAARRRESLHKRYPDGSVIPADEPLPPIFDGPFWLYH